MEEVVIVASFSKYKCIQYYCFHYVTFSCIRNAHFTLLISVSCLTVALVSSGKERGRPTMNLLSSPRETRAGMREHSPMPSPETMSLIEDMAHKLLNEDEVAAVMRHCKRVSQQKVTLMTQESLIFFLMNCTLWNCKPSLM